MKKIIFPLLIIVFMLLACTISIPATVSPGGVTEPVSPPVVTDTVPPEPSGPPTNASCNEVSLYLDPALASGLTCTTVPESPEGIEVYPQYTKLTLTGYLLSDKFFEPQIRVFHVQRYTELLPDYIPGRVSALQGLIGGAAPGDSSLPFLPTFNAGQVFHARYQVLPFASGGGIRYLTLFAQYFAPINNHDLFYTYQGLTADGQHWVAAILPITHPILPVTGDNPPGGMSWEDFGNNYDSYIADISAQLNGQPPDSFAPSLVLLDALASSITIQP